MVGGARFALGPSPAGCAALGGGALEVWNRGRGDEGGELGKGRTHRVPGVVGGPG